VGQGIGLTIERSRVRLLAGSLPGNNSGQVADTHVPIVPLLRSSKFFGTSQTAVTLCGWEGMPRA